MGRRRPLRRRHLEVFPRFPRGRPEAWGGRRRRRGRRGGAGRGERGGAGRRERGGAGRRKRGEPGAGARRRAPPRAAGAGSAAAGSGAPPGVAGARRRPRVARDGARGPAPPARGGARGPAAAGSRWGAPGARRRGRRGGAGRRKRGGTGRRERGGTGRRERCGTGRRERGGGSRWGARPRAAGSRRGARPRAAGSRWGARKRWGSNPLDRVHQITTPRVDGDDPGPLHVELLRCITSAPEDVPRLLVVGHHGVGADRTKPMPLWPNLRPAEQEGRRDSVRTDEEIETQIASAALEKRCELKNRSPTCKFGASPFISLALAYLELLCPRFHPP